METNSRHRNVLAANVKTLKDYYGLSIQAFGKKCGISHSTIGRAVLSRGALDLDSIAAISEACGLEPWQLLIPNLDPRKPPVVTALTSTERDLYAKLSKSLGLSSPGK